MISLGNGVKVRPNSCPTCNSNLDGLSEVGSVETSPPQAGDLSVCGHCGTMLRFTNRLHLEIVDGDEFKKLDREDHKAAELLLKTREAVREAIAERAKR